MNKAKLDKAIIKAESIIEKHNLKIGSNFYKKQIKTIIVPAIQNIMKKDKSISEVSVIFGMGTCSVTIIQNGKKKDLYSVTNDNLREIIFYIDDMLVDKFGSPKDFIVKPPKKRQNDP